MKYIAYIFVLTIVIGYLFVSCDKVDEPYLRNVVPDTNDTTILKRKILIEDFTGHQCPNCPTAADIATAIHETYPNQVVVMAIHAGNFAKPDATGNFTYDFRTPEGNMLNTDFGFGTSYPIGLISRIPSSTGQWGISHTKWTETVDTLVDDLATVKLKLTNSYVPATRTSSVTVKTDFLADIDQSCFLCVYLTEDSIIKPQKKGSQTILNYVHMHVLRTSYDGLTYGTKLNTIPLLNGASFTNSYNLVLKPEWVEKNCNIVAYIFREDTKEILQVETVKVK